MALAIADRTLHGALVLALWGGGGACLAADEQPPAARPVAAGRSSLLDMSIEDLAQVQITSVSRKAERLADAPASVYVITGDDIRRSGATSIAEALRLAPNLQVARIDASQYAISARGFNSSTANKLLVLMDGRSLYTPLFSGVFWDVQDTLVEDIERIEVISGPGATLWGANAVNGVISIITRNARDTGGTLLSASGGNQARGAAARAGRRVSENWAWRAYAKHLEHDATHRATGAPVRDAWHIGQAGFRADGDLGPGRVTWQGDVYDGRIDQALPGRKRISGHNLLGRWSRELGAASGVQVQLYYDHTRRDFPGTFAERRNTWDIEAQHHFAPFAGHELVWGGGVRSSSDQVTNSPGLAFLPTDSTLKQYSVFAHDTYQWLPQRAELTIGVRIDHNDYSGVDVQPNLRLAWKLAPDQMVWTSIARATRAPSRIDRELFVPGTPPFLLAGGPNFKSEVVNTLEAGYRGAVGARGTLSATVFVNDYSKLRSLQPATGAPVPVVLENRIEGHGYGFETWGDWLVTASGRLRAGYWWMNKKLHVEPGAAPDPAGLRGAGNDPRYQAMLRLSLDPAPGWEFDTTLRRVGRLPDPRVPAYTGVDVRIGWQPHKRLELSVGGLNLLDRRHPEFGTAPTGSEIQRSFYAKALWSF